MTESIETRRFERPFDPFDASWRMERQQAQEAVVPDGRVVVSCTAPLGMGGLGRHFKEVADALQRHEQPTFCISGAAREPELRPKPRWPSMPAPARLLSRLPTSSARGWGMLAFCAEFDDYAAQRLPGADHLIAFNGQASRQLQDARRAGYKSLTLVSANSHLRNVVRQHARAQRQYPLEGSWAARLVERNVAEYARVDRIYVASRYTMGSFLEEGVREDVLSPFPFTPDPRYRPDGAAASETFDVVYIGSLSVAKGVPLLIDAVRRLPHADIRLHLIGGWGSRGMRRFIEDALRIDHRISVSPGDPLPHLRRARLCVHPTYEDGFAYAPTEALACGVPVIVSEDTGMKDLIDPGHTGLILPTGNLDALTEAIEAAYRGEILASAAVRSPRE